MKKNLFFVAAAVALVGCSSDESLSNDVALQDGELVPVQLSLTRNAVNVYQTRGTGTVGDLESNHDGNIYQNEDLYVLMTNVPTETKPWDFTTVGTLDGPSLGRQFDGSFKSRPGMQLEQDGQRVWGIDYTPFTGGQKKYYSTDASYSEFYAFHIDDAAEVSTENIIMSEDSTQMTIDFKIDGSQDILAGKAEKSDDELVKYPQRGFSAKTARNGVIPTISMKHLLTRLTFTVVAGNANAEGLVIDSIQVASNSEGALIVAYDEEQTKDPSELIEWNEESLDTFLLKAIPEGDRLVADEEIAGVYNKTKLEAKESIDVITPADVVLNEDGKFVPRKVGDALFVQPNQKSFKLYLTCSYPYDGENGEKLYYQVTDSYVISLPNDALLEIGKSYNVQMTVYGLSEIELKTTLEGWIEGEEISVGADEWQ